MEESEFSMMMMKERVKEILGNEDWTFADLQDMNLLVDNVSKQILTDLTAEEKLELVWDVPVSDLETFGMTFETVLLTQMQTVVVGAIKVALLEAKVSFNNKEVNKNEVSEGSMGRKSSEERTPDEKADSK